MRHSLLTLLVAALTLSGCGQSKSEAPAEDTLFTDDIFNLDEPVKGETYETRDSVRWRGNLCAYHILSQSGEELGVVETETGRKYCETVIRLSIEQGGATLFQHTFTKADFADQLPADLRRIGLLSNMTLHEVTDGHLKFSTIVAEPQSDYYVPFGITISPSGQMAIRAEEDIFNTTGAPDMGD